MKIVALVSGLGWHVEDLERAARRLGVEFRPIAFNTITGGIGPRGLSVRASGVDLARQDGLLLRMMPPDGLERVIFRMDAAHLVERLGVPVLNPPRAVEVSVDKYLSLSMIQAAKLPVPATIACESAAAALDAFDALGADVVVKPLFGSEGRGLLRVAERELARRVFHTLEQLGSVLYVQRTIRHPGFDYRAFVLGGRVLAAMRRHGPSGDWRTNIAVGGRPEACVLEPALERLALDAAAAVGASMAGVDLLDDLDAGSPVVLEVNAVPGWKALGAATGRDVALAILEHLQDLARCARD